MKLYHREDITFNDSLEWTTETPEGETLVKQLPNVFNCFCGFHPLPQYAPHYHYISLESQGYSNAQSLVLISGTAKSGSTAAWQVADLLTNGRSVKSHSFSDNCPSVFKFEHVIITVRHPFDQMYSNGFHLANNLHKLRILKEWEDVGRYVTLSKFQQTLGYRRDMKITFLKYEDFWNKDLKRVKFLSNLINKNISEEEAKAISTDTCIEKNYERSKLVFGENRIRMINENHIDDKRGRPGQGKALDRVTKQDILDSCEWAFDEFGYSKDF